MLQRILAPSDGSLDSEKALPLAAQIALAQDAELILVSVFDDLGLASAGSGDLTPDQLEQILHANEERVHSHLLELEAQLKIRGVRVRSAVRRGPITSGLLDWENEERPDLLVITTHGRTGVARFALGSVADRMVREGSAPVLVVRRSASPLDKLETALLMLDGSGRAEEVLPMVEQLAGKPLQSLILFRVVADPGDRGPALTYLEAVAARLSKLGLDVRSVVDIGEARHDVERVAKDADLVILCTHGRTGFDRIRHGSVAEYVVREVDKPTLLVRARS